MMRIRFHMSYGSVVEHDVPGMNDLGHVVNTLRSRGMLYVNGYKGVILERHVMYVEEAPIELNIEDHGVEKIRGEKLHSMEFDESLGRTPEDVQSARFETIHTGPGGIIEEHWYDPKAEQEINDYVHDVKWGDA